MIATLLQLIAPSRCPICGDYLALGECVACRGCSASLTVTADACERTQIPRISLFAHDSTVRSAVLALKFGGDAWRGLGMGLLFSTADRHVSRFEFDCIVPVPLHRRRLRVRGYNQAERIARGASRSLRSPVRTDLLKRVRHDSAQAKSSEDERRSRDNPFASTPGRRRVLLIDDVTTTGTTLAQAAESLIEAGHSPVVMLAVARQIRHDGQGEAIALEHDAPRGRGIARSSLPHSAENIFPEVTIVVA